jgi:methyltransferase (TIGR00027 family)
VAEKVVGNVSDTARWVAVYRAWESARPDALFKDPLAERLAGERGRAIAALAPRQARNGWPMIARTRLIDDLVLSSLAEGCDRVVNLAAGFDTRPYRLELPAELSWVEVDLPALVAEKEGLLAGETPRCRLTREQADLADPRARTAVLERATAGASRALVITEGLLIYLEAEVVRSLARDLLGRGAIRHWLLDLASPVIAAMVTKGMGEHLANAPLRFAPPEGIAFFEALGWRVRDMPSIFHEAVRFRRVPLLLRPFALLPKPDPRNVGRARWSAVIRLERP